MVRSILAFVCLFLANIAFAQDAIPADRYIITQDMDFYGSDRATLFDTTQSACRRACSADSACVGFTFNTRSNACFPKSAISDRQPYEGAVSAQRIVTSADDMARARARAAELDFLRPEDLSAARDLADGIAARFPAGGREIADVLGQATAALNRGNRLRGLGWIATGIALTDRGDLWESYADIALRFDVDNQSAERRRYGPEALPAAINAYLRAGSAGAQANALQTMANALQRNRRGKDSIPALTRANQLVPRDDLATALDEAIARYGFRVVDDTVDSDSAVPRLCAEFSDPLDQGLDYTPFVSVDANGYAVEAEGNQLCIEGLSHGQRYTVTLRAGLPSADGTALVRQVTLRAYMRDRSPLVRFPGRTFVLPRTAEAAIPVETVNLSEVELRLRRVSDRNLLRAIQDGYFGVPLNAWQDGNFASELAQEVWTGAADITSTLNQDVTTRLPLGEVLAELPTGIYALSARVPGGDPYDDPAATQWFVLTDIGLASWSGTDGLTVAARSLGTAQALPGAEVQLISQANVVLGTAIIDTDGFAQFPAGLVRGRGGAAPALLVAMRGDDDIAFLPLTGPAFDLSDRGVEGRPPSPPIDTFLTTDRGAYRPGEVIHVTALMRGPGAGALTGLPLTAILSRPDGVEYSRTVRREDLAGGHVFALPVAADAPRGTWRLEVKSDLDAPALASTRLLVEDFLPERIDVALALPDAPLRLTDTPPLRVTANYLFGAPAADLGVEGRVTVTRRTGLDGFPGYSFGRYDTEFRPSSAYLEGTRTGDDGSSTLPLNLPDVTGAEGLLLEARATITVSEGSGRPVEREITAPITPDGVRLGLKPLFEDVVPEGQEARFDLVAVGGDVPVRWTLNRVTTRYQWYSLYGNWQWEPITRRTRVASGQVQASAVSQTVAGPVDWGRYEMVVETADGRVQTALDFFAGWYGAGEGTETPDRLQMSLDAPRYSPGDTAQLRVVSPASGTALITVASNRVIDRQAVDLVAGDNLIPLPVTQDWGAGAYVTASAIRPMDAAAGRNPSRSLGVVYAEIDPGPAALAVTLDAPEAVDGQPGTFDVTVRAAGLQAGDTAYVTLAAVDVGILNLTGFEAPDPSTHYFGQRRLGVELRDIYGRLIDGLNGDLGRVRSGGDASRGLSRQSPPPTEELMVAFSGPVQIGADGTATISVPKPAFNGAIRLMAVVWSDTGVGQASQDVLARDPVVLSASFPRFLAPGDQSEALIELVHAGGPIGAAQITISAPSLTLGQVPTSVALEDGGTVRVPVALSGTQIGDHQVSVTLETPGGQTLARSYMLGIRQLDPETATTRRFSLGVGEAFTFDDAVLAGLRGGSATLSAGPLARFDMPGLLARLDRYPYGCTEQVTSAAMPLLYLSQMAGAVGTEDTGRRIEAAIARVLTRQGANGSFGLWRVGSGDLWLDAYVTDFLSRARAQGFPVPSRAYDAAMDNLLNRVGYAPDFDTGGEEIAYALLVLARAGKASMGDLRYYADTKTRAFGSPLAAAQLGAALALYGDQMRADRMFAVASEALAGPRSQRAVWRSDYGSHLRDAAGVLKLAAEVGSTAVDRTTLAQRLGTSVRPLSTQEAAQVLLAAHALGTDTGNPGLTVDDVPTSGPVAERRLAGQAPSVVRNVSGQPMDVTVTAYGVPSVAPEAGGYGYAIRRSYYTMDGVPADGPFAAGERRVAVLTITPFEEVGARLMVDDALPAGLEIDNPNLLRAGDVRALDWLKPAQAEWAEFRAERFLAAVDHRSDEPFTLAYIVRAISPGDYHHPAPLVEDMYRPEYRAVGDTGRLVVIK